MKPNLKTESGQVMPLALAGMLALIGMTFFAFNVGRLIAQRERTRMLTDVTTLSGATVYARCLNFGAAVKKINDVTGFLNDAVGWFPWGGQVLVAADEIVTAVREGFEAAAPYLTLGSTEIIAFANQVPALPLWNLKDIYDVQSLAQAIVPDLKFDTEEDKNSGSSSATNSAESSDHYSYQKKSSGETVEVDGSRVEEDETGGAKGSHRDQKTGRFVKKSQSQDAKAEGVHSITLITYDISPDVELPSFLLKKLPKFWSISRARISGGNFEFSSSSSMEWGCFLAPVTVKDFSVSLDLPEIPMSGFSSIDSWSNKVNKISREAKQWASRVPAILH